MAINVAEITSILKREIAEFDQKLSVTEVGTVVEVGDGIARIYGLRNAMAGELLEFENGTMGQVFNLEEDANTISGLIQDRLGRIPAVGEELRIGQCRLVIHEADHKSIKSVQIFKEDKTVQTTEAEPVVLSDEASPVAGQRRAL